MTEYKKIFLDTAPIIYLIDNDENFCEKTKAIINKAVKSCSALITSVITREEYLVYPYRTGNTEKIEAFSDFLRICKVSVCFIDDLIADKAAQIHARYKDFKGMDCLQLAAAVISGCDMFLTNDKQLKQFDEICVLIIDDF